MTVIAVVAAERLRRVLRHGAADIVEQCREKAPRLVVVARRGSKWTTTTAISGKRKNNSSAHSVSNHWT